MKYSFTPTPRAAASGYRHALPDYAKPLDRDPYTKDESGQLYLNFDTIEFDTSSFMWRIYYADQLVATMSTDLLRGGVFHIVDMQARVKVSIAK